MKKIIRNITPNFLKLIYRRGRLFIETKSNNAITTEEVFSKIYTMNIWGGEKGQFYSGTGSANEKITSPYISMISDMASNEGFLGLRFVDLGCGDFRLGSKLLPMCSQYVGVDIVNSLIEYNKKQFSNEKTSFIHSNIIEENLPEGDVCFVRQVLQHLSNQQICAILPKLSQYRWVFITEHYPSFNHNIRPNLDKVHGAAIRAYKNSGVYLTEPPFNIPNKLIKQVLEVPDINHGIIRTFLFKPEF
jgi:hypothetical protein